MQVPALRAQQTSVEIPDEVKDLFSLAANMEGITPRLPQIAIIHRGQMFVMPDESKIDKFEGIILDQHSANAWWEQDMSASGGGSIPDCFSLDGITPDLTREKVQAKLCRECKQNQFGSDLKTGKGKACKNMKRLHVLMEGSLLPRRVTIPPSSIKKFEEYMTKLVDRGLNYAMLVTDFSLKKIVDKAFEYAEINLVVNRVLNKEELLQVAKFIRQYKEGARQQEIHADEYVGKQEVETDIPY